MSDKRSDFKNRKRTKKNNTDNEVVPRKTTSTSINKYDHLKDANLTSIDPQAPIGKSFYSGDKILSGSNISPEEARTAALELERQKNITILYVKPNHLHLTVTYCEDSANPCINTGSFTVEDFRDNNVAIAGGLTLLAIERSDSEKFKDGIPDATKAYIHRAKHSTEHQLPNGFYK